MKMNLCENQNMLYNTRQGRIIVVTNKTMVSSPQAPSAQNSPPPFGSAIH